MQRPVSEGWRILRAMIEAELGYRLDPRMNHTMRLVYFRGAGLTIHLMQETGGMTEGDAAKLWESVVEDMNLTHAEVTGDDSRH